MKFSFTPYIYIVFFLLSIHGLNAQDQKLEIRINAEENTGAALLKNYTQNLNVTDSLNGEINTFIRQIELMGYLNARIDSLVQIDSTSIAYIDPGLPIEHITINHDLISDSYLSQKELNTIASSEDASNIRIPFSTLSAFMESLVDLFEAKGNSFVRFSLSNIELIDSEARASLIMDMNWQRQIDKIVVKGYEDFPKKFLRHDLGLKVGTVFNREKLAKASNAINNTTFAQEVKPPEILFTNDSTIIYLYLKKKKSNQFDGIVGFASKEDDDGLEFNGYLDLRINNIFNGGETIALYWKNNGNSRQRFYLEAEIPYIFNLPLIPKANFEIYRQDSTFSNTKLQINLLYNTIGKGAIAAELQTENSNDLSTGTSTGVNSFSNLFYGLSYNFRKLALDPLFPVTYQIYVSALIGNRASDAENTPQSKLTLNANYLYAFNQNNYLFIQNTSGLLNSSDFLANELFRYGGIYNLRGVNEESIFASAYTVFNLEYRYKPNLSSYFYTITDYSYAENKLVETNTNIISFGVGYAFETKAGILNISYALGKFDDEPFEFNNSKIHIKIISKF